MRTTDRQSSMFSNERPWRASRLIALVSIVLTAAMCLAEPSAAAWRHGAVYTRPHANSSRHVSHFGITRTNCSRTNSAYNRGTNAGRNAGAGPSHWRPWTGRGTGTVVLTPPSGSGNAPPRYPLPGPGRPQRPGLPIFVGPIVPPSGGTIIVNAPPPQTIVNAPPLTGGPRPNGGGGARPVGPTGPTTVAANARFVPDEILVTFVGGASPAAIANFTQSQRLALLGVHRLPLINAVIYRFRITDGRAVPTVLGGLRSDARLAATQPNYLYFMTDSGRQTVVDPSQYVPIKLHLPQAHTLATGRGILIAVIDTALDTEHRELRGAIVGRFDAVKTEFHPLPHGTAMAGAIVAHGRLMGVAPSARILAVRAFDASEAGTRATTTRLLDSLQWAATSGARIVNMSFAGPDDPGLRAMIASLHQKGLVLVAAAGNDGPQAPPAYPAAYPGVIAVTATDMDDHLLRVANHGSYVAVAAPGVNVFVAAPNGGYDFTSGTSIACAHVSGLAALLLERNPRLTPDAVAGVLMHTAHRLGAQVRDDAFGAGLVDAYEAVLEQAPAVAQQGTVH